ncbi:hypothetical protein D3C85_1205100 [compost metagenome]
MAAQRTQLITLLMIQAEGQVSITAGYVSQRINGLHQRKGNASGNQQDEGAEQQRHWDHNGEGL